jgi:hypothetical protein
MCTEIVKFREIVKCTQKRAKFGKMVKCSKIVEFRKMVKFTQKLGQILENG